ncbi:MAG TPA: WGxxGxxG family protein [Allosphingosinicella sp.]|jgi:MYXO-CTERM domain-containing protein
MRSIAKILAVAALLASAPALAQGTGTGSGSVGTPGSGVGNGTVDTSYGNPQPDDEGGFPWGLLGLIGLAGLLPRKRPRADVGDHTTRP